MRVLLAVLVVLVLAPPPVTFASEPGKAATRGAPREDARSKEKALPFDDGSKGTAKEKALPFDDGSKPVRKAEPKKSPPKAKAGDKKMPFDDGSKGTPEKEKALPFDDGSKAQ